MSKPRFSLQVFHPSIDPRQITEELGLPPVRVRRVGERRSNPKGLLPGVNKQTAWWTHLAGDESGAGNLESALTDIAARLEPYRFFLERMRAEGGRVEIFIGWFLEGMEGLTLDHKLLAKFGALGVDLLFDVYPPDDKEAEGVPDRK